MTKGTTSKGGRNHRLHTICPRCGRHSLHFQKGTCSSCAFPQPRRRMYNFIMKAYRRRGEGSGKMSHINEVIRRSATGSILYK